jgi:hypothetical protein
VHPPSCVCCVREQAQRGRPADRLVPPRSPSPTSCFVLRVLNRVRVVYGIIGIAKLSTGTGKPDWRPGFWSVSPQISPKGIARVPPTQHPAGTGPGRRAPPGEAKKKNTEKRHETRNQKPETRRPGGERICSSFGEPPTSIPATNRLTRVGAPSRRCPEQAHQHQHEAVR